LLIINRFSYFIVLESSKTISFQSPPKYTNAKLQQKINEQKNNSDLRLSEMKLTCKDMEIVCYCLLQNNTVKIILFIIWIPPKNAESKNAESKMSKLKISTTKNIEN
jgi:hypothetical protein